MLNRISRYRFYDQCIGTYHVYNFITFPDFLREQSSHFFSFLTIYYVFKITLRYTAHNNSKDIGLQCR